jgi:mono/diheme cytochrome c family protein
MRSRTAWVILVFLVAMIAVALMRFNLTALPEPGRLETRLANRGRHFLIRRASRQGIPPSPQNRSASSARGDTLYGLDCGMCHGADGRSQTGAGRWMYPRAADLTAEDVQSYSDQELFWIVKNGIRFSGMPAFGRVETDEHIWNLVDYVRTLPLRPKNSTQ